MLDSLVLEELPGLSIRERMLGMNVGSYQSPDEYYFGQGTVVGMT